MAGSKLYWVHVTAAGCAPNDVTAPACHLAIAKDASTRLHEVRRVTSSGPEAWPKQLGRVGRN